MKRCSGCFELFEETDLTEVVENDWHTTKYRLYCKKCYRKYV